VTAKLKSLGVLVAAVAALTFPAPGLAAFNGHEYSIVYETTGWKFDGLQVTRLDHNFSPPGSGSGCTTYFGTNPVYQTEWAFMNTDGSNWEEFGTADQCMNFRYLFWGYALARVWHPLGEAASPGGLSLHDFTMTRSSSGVWTFKLDGTTKGTDTWSEAVEISTGLESYVDMVISQERYFPLLAATVPNGTWHTWSGRDIRSVGPDMCGRWAGDDDWRAAEHSVC